MSNYDDWLRSQMQPAPQRAMTAPEPKEFGSLVPLLLNVVLVAVVVWLLVLRPSEPGPGPGPDPSVDVVVIVERSTKDYANNLAKVMDSLAEKVQSGEIRTRKDAFTYATTYTSAARTNAFAPVDRLDNDQLPEGDWTGKESGVVLYLREKAKGHRRAGQ
jgi:hypothetical protein